MCDACDLAEQNPQTGRYNADCDECHARAIACGMEAFEASKCGRVTPRLKSALRRIWGENWESVGLVMVKRWASRQKEKA